MHEYDLRLLLAAAFSLQADLGLPRQPGDFLDSQAHLAGWSLLPPDAPPSLLALGATFRVVEDRRVSNVIEQREGRGAGAEREVSSGVRLAEVRTQQKVRLSAFPLVCRLVSLLETQGSCWALL